MVSATTGAGYLEQWSDELCRIISVLLGRDKHNRAIHHHLSFPIWIWSGNPIREGCVGKSPFPSWAEEFRINNYPLSRSWRHMFLWNPKLSALPMRSECSIPVGIVRIEVHAKWPTKMGE